MFKSLRLAKTRGVLFHGTGRRTVRQWSGIKEVGSESDPHKEAVLDLTLVD